MRKDRGFTLTELLVVISIIGILAGIILVSGGTVRQDARDKRRKADIEQIAGLLQIRAVQIKLSDPARWTPVSYGEQNISDLGVNWDASYIDGDSDGQFFVDFLADEGYSTQIPLDPLHASATNFYQYRIYINAVGTCRPPLYVAIARLEGTGNADRSCLAGLTPDNYYVVTGG